MAKLGWIVLFFATVAGASGNGKSGIGKQSNETSRGKERKNGDKTPPAYLMKLQQLRAEHPDRVISIKERAKNNVQALKLNSKHNEITRHMFAGKRATSNEEKEQALRHFYKALQDKTDALLGKDAETPVGQEALRIIAQALTIGGDVGLVLLDKIEESKMSAAELVELFGGAYKGNILDFMDAVLGAPGTPIRIKSSKMDSDGELDGKKAQK